MSTATYERACQLARDFNAPEIASCRACGESIYRDRIAGTLTTWAHHIERGDHLANS